MIFGGGPAILTTRPRGETSRLPMQLDISTSPLAALPRVALGAVLAVLGAAAYGGFADRAAFGPEIGLLFRLAPLALIGAGLIAFARGAIGLADRRTARIEGGRVTVSGKSLLRSENWSEPLDAYAGVRWREIVVQRRTGSNRSSSSRPRVYQVLDLLHPDPARCIPLRVTRLTDGMRPEWERLARLLDLPAIDARGGAAQVRAAADVDKSIRELADEGKIEAEWDGRPPPAGLEVVHEGGEETPQAQAILVTIRARKFPLWIYGALLAAGAVLVLMGAFDLALLPVVFGGGLGAGVVWHWRSEARNPRTIRITRTRLLIDTPNPGNPARHEEIEHRAIESVEIARPYDRGAIGPQLVIATDRAEYRAGAGLSREGLAWLRALILSAVARA